MSEKVWLKPQDLDIIFTAEMFEDLNNALTGIDKRTLMSSSYTYQDGRLMKVGCDEFGIVTIELSK